jgi:hypothetical protein
LREFGFGSLGGLNGMPYFLRRFTGFVVRFVVMQILLEHVFNTTAAIVCQTSPPWILEWNTILLPWPFQNRHPYTVFIQGPVEAILNDPTGIETLTAMDDFNLRVTPARNASDHASLEILRFRSEEAHLDNSLSTKEEVASMAQERIELHERSEDLLHAMHRKDI